MSTDLLQPGGGLTKSKLALADATTGDVLSGKKFYAGDKVIKAGSMANNGAWSSSLAPGGSVVVPQGYHNGGGRVSAEALKTVSMNVATWPHEYPAMEWNYTLTGGTLVGIASLDGGFGEGNSNIVDSIRIAENTIYVANRQGGFPNRYITLIYY